MLCCPATPSSGGASSEQPSWRGRSPCSFLVIARGGSTRPSCPRRPRLGAVRAMFELFAARKDHGSWQYAFAGERGGALVVEVASGEELDDMVASLPAARLIAFEVHALMSTQHALQSIAALQQALAGQMAPGPGPQGCAGLVAAPLGPAVGLPVRRPLAQARDVPLRSAWRRTKRSRKPLGKGRDGGGGGAGPGKGERTASPRGERSGGGGLLGRGVPSHVPFLTARGAAFAGGWVLRRRRGRVEEAQARAEPGTPQARRGSDAVVAKYGAGYMAGLARKSGELQRERDGRERFVAMGRASGARPPQAAAHRAERRGRRAPAPRGRAAGHEPDAPARAGVLSPAGARGRQGDKRPRGADYFRELGRKGGERTRERHGRGACPADPSTERRARATGRRRGDGGDGGLAAPGRGLSGGRERPAPHRAARRGPVYGRPVTRRLHRADAAGATGDMGGAMRAWLACNRRRGGWAVRHGRRARRARAREPPRRPSTVGLSLPYAKADRVAAGRAPGAGAAQGSAGMEELVAAARASLTAHLARLTARRRRLGGLRGPDALARGRRARRPGRLAPGGRYALRREGQPRGPAARRSPPAAPSRARGRRPGRGMPPCARRPRSAGGASRRRKPVAARVWAAGRYCGRRRPARSHRT